MVVQTRERFDLLVSQCVVRDVRKTFVHFGGVLSMEEADKLGVGNMMVDMKGVDDMCQEGLLSLGRIGP